MPLPIPRKPDLKIDISPLVDVVFQLLIFFVVTTTFLSDTGIPLELPEAESGQQQGTEQEDLSVRIAADGAIQFQGEVVSLADLETKMRQFFAQTTKEAITIYGDGSVDYETIIQVMDVVRRVEVPGIVLATQEPLSPPK